MHLMRRKISKTVNERVQKCTAFLLKNIPRRQKNCRVTNQTYTGCTGTVNHIRRRDITAVLITLRGTLEQLRIGDQQLISINGSLWRPPVEMRLLFAIPVTGARKLRLSATISANLLFVGLSL